MHALLAATLLSGVGAAGAFAQDSGPVFDPAQLPAVHGKVMQYDLTPRGDVDGLILADGLEVHFPPHFGTQVVAVVHPGDTVTVHGLKARVIPLVRAMSVTADASGKTVVTEHEGPGRGPHHGHRPPPPRFAGQTMQVQGTVRTQLHGPQGELNGVLLQDGTMVHLPPPVATRYASDLQPGKTLAVQGNGVANDLGRSIAALAIGPSMNELTQLPAPPRPPHPHGHHHHHGDHGPDAPPPPPAPGTGPNGG
jgi:hypothetical protein